MFDFIITRIGRTNQAAFDCLIPDSLRQRLQNDPNVLALGAVLYDQACGAIVFELSAGSLEILSLHMTPDAGFAVCALELIEAVADAAAKCGRASAIRATFTGADIDEEQALLTAYRAAGFAVEQNEMAQFSLSIQRLMEIPALSGPLGTGSVSTLKGFSAVEYYALNAFLKSSAAAYIEVPVKSGDVLADISVVHSDPQGKIDGALLFNNLTAGGFSLALLVLRDRRASAFAMPMFKTAIRLIADHYPDSGTIRVSAVSAEAERLVRKLASGAIIRERPVFTARRAVVGSTPYMSASELTFSIMEGM